MKKSVRVKLITLGALIFFVVILIVAVSNFKDVMLGPEEAGIYRGSKLKIGEAQQTESQPNVTCKNDAECDTGSQCSIGKCKNNKCEYTAKPDGADCTASGNNGKCLHGLCINQGDCSKDDECKPPGNPTCFLKAYCDKTTKKCVVKPTPDGIICGRGLVCRAGVCVPSDTPGWCNYANPCPTYLLPYGKACWKGDCVNGFCVYSRKNKPGCWGVRVQPTP